MRFLAIPGAIVSGIVLSAQSVHPALPSGAIAFVNQDTRGSMIALCADTGAPDTVQGAKVIKGTGVWAGLSPNLHRVNAGLGACDPAWSPDGRKLAVTSADGLWVFPADSSDGDLRVRARQPLGSIDYAYRAFSTPRWSPDGVLVALLVTNGGTSWVEVFDASTGRLVYTSPPDQDSFSWTGGRELQVGDTRIQLSLQ